MREDGKTTSSDLAALGHLPQRGRLHVPLQSTRVGNGTLVQLQKSILQAEENPRQTAVSAGDSLFSAIAQASFSPPSFMATQKPMAKVTRLTITVTAVTPARDVPIRIATGEATTRPRIAQ